MFSDIYLMPNTTQPKSPTCLIQATHAYIYARVSTAAQHTLDAQISRCEQHAKDCGWIIVDRIREVGSAMPSYTNARPRFRALLERAQIHIQQFDTVILVDEVTRLSRHGPDADRLIATGIPFHVRNADGPLRNKHLRDGIRTAARASRTKSGSQKRTNKTRDKARRPRGLNLNADTRGCSHSASRERIKENVRRAALCLAMPLELLPMTDAQIVICLRAHGVRRRMSTKTAREADWTVREVRHHRAEIDAEIQAIKSVRGWFHDLF